MAGVTERGLWFSGAQKVSEYSKDKNGRHLGGGVERQVSDCRRTCASVVVVKGSGKMKPWAGEQTRQVHEP